MVGICLEGVEKRSEYDIAEFESRFVEICDEHRASGRALAFAFILYDYRNPHMLKVLRDSDYWRALDRLSGQYLTVFSFEAAEPEDDSTIERRSMVGVTGGRGDPGKKNQMILRSYFGLTGRFTLPAVLFFQVHEGRIVDYELWQLDEARVEDAFNDLRDAIGLAVEAVQKVVDENRANSHEIFHLIGRRLSERRLRLRLSKGLKVLAGAKEASSFVRMLL